jgi:putative membrane protein PagO
VALAAAAVLHGFCYIFTKRYGGDVSVVTYNTLPIGLSGLAMTLAGLSVENTHWAQVSPASWGALVYLAVSAVFAFLAYFYLLKIMSPVLASYSYLIFPVLAILIDSRMTGTPLDPQFLIFTAVILSGFAITKVATPR